MMMASFTTRKKNINMNIVQVYAPTNDAEDEVKDSFYNKLQNVVSKLPNKDVNIIMGDLNAKVGSDNENYEEVMGKHGLGEINDNGDRLLGFCTFNKMVIGGTVFPHKKIHKSTWVSTEALLTTGQVPARNSAFTQSSCLLTKVCLLKQLLNQ